jgi:hypothetical protein
MTAWLRASLSSGDADSCGDSDDVAGLDDAEGAGGARPGGLVPRTVKQIRNRTGYVLTKMRPRQAEERFADAYRARAARVAPSPDEDGTGSLTVTHAWPLLQLADRHLSLLARQDRGPDDERTLAQARADTLVGLLTGRLFVARRADSAPDVPAPTPADVVGGVAAEAVAGSLARARAAGFAHPADAPLPRWPAPLQLRRTLSAPSHARPVINVTVPVQTLMGVTDDPGVAAGGSALPAGLVRLLAADPAATWYRMLTDPARGTVELSTTSYQPAAPIWRQVVADWQTCYQPACTQPATTVELDHRVPWPAGQTSTTGLEPACKRDHKAKHATGFRLQRRHQGDPASRALQLTTPAGFAHRADPAVPPVGDGWGPAWRYEHPYTPAEVRDALDHLHHTGTQLVESLETMLAEEARQHRLADPDASDTDGGASTGASRRWGNRDALHHQWLIDEGIHR